MNDKWELETKALVAVLEKRPWDAPESLYQIPYGQLALLEFAARELAELAQHAYDVVTGAVDA